MPPVPDSGQMKALLVMAGRKKLTLPKESSLFWFVRSQIPFVNRGILAAQLMLFCLYGFFTNVILHDREGILLLVPAAPLVVLIGTAEISRSFRCNMAELELPSRFSLPQVLLARLVITAVVDMLSLTSMLFLTSGMESGTTFGLLILYGLVPAFLAAAGSLFLLNHCRAANVQYYVSAYCAGLSAFGAVSVKEWPQWYNGTAIAVWLAVLGIAVMGFAVELYKMLNECPQRMEYAA